MSWKDAYSVGTQLGYVGTPPYHLHLIDHEYSKYYNNVLDADNHSSHKQKELAISKEMTYMYKKWD